jgi:hypothetical protein
MIGFDLVFTRDGDGSAGCDSFDEIWDLPRFRDVLSLFGSVLTSGSFLSLLVFNEDDLTILSLLFVYLTSSFNLDLDVVFLRIWDYVY